MSVFPIGLIHHHGQSYLTKLVLVYLKRNVSLSSAQNLNKIPFTDSVGHWIKILVLQTWSKDN
jgi:hypothetical protein